MLEDKYKECREIFKKFIKKGYWTDFSSADLFYIMDGNKRSIFTFVEQFFEDSYGAQLFFNRNGLNYVHDILTTSGDTSVTIHDCDSICAVFVPRKSLKDDEIEFLRSINIRLNENSNLIFHRFEAGFGPRLANAKEIGIFLDVLEYLSSIIQNEYNDIIESFKEDKTVVCLMDRDNMQYSIVYRSLPYLEALPQKKPVNKGFVEEFKNALYVNDECYLFTSYLPAVIKETGVRPLAIYFYYPKTNKHFFRYINDVPKEYGNWIYSILYEAFTQVGLPVKLIFNNRNIYAILEKTINALNIEHEFIREDYTVDSNVNDVLSRIYETTRDEFVESNDLISLMMDSISKALDELSEESEELIDSVDNEFVS